MASLNRVLIIGNLGQDPEIRYTQNQTAVCTLSIATTDVRTGQDGQRQEFTEWHRVVVWNKAAENCAKYLTKGRPVFIEGRLQTRSWEDKTGQKRYTTEIIANNVQFLGAGGQARDTGMSAMGNAAGAGNGARDFNQAGGMPPAAMSSGIGGPETPGLDDIPF